MIPHIIKYTDNMPEGVGGYARWFFIAIRPKYRDDVGIHEHELEHVRQWWLPVLICSIAAAVLYSQGYIDYALYAALVGPSVHPLLYKFIPAYKLWSEVQAYKEQLPHYPDDRTAMFAGFIATRYGLDGVSQEHAEKLLRG
jgi:hypothetical protein